MPAHSPAPKWALTRRLVIVSRGGDNRFPRRRRERRTFLRGQNVAAEHDRERGYPAGGISATLSIRRTVARRTASSARASPVTLETGSSVAPSTTAK